MTSPKIQKNQLSIFLLAINHIPTKKIAVVKISIHDTKPLHLSKKEYRYETKRVDEMIMIKIILISASFILVIGVYS